MTPEHRPVRSVWTRRVAADLFPGSATPFAWTFLAGPVEAALRAAYAELGATGLRAGPLWQRTADGRVFVAEDALTAADRELRGAAWLAADAPARPTGLLARMQAGGVTRRADARIAIAEQGSAGLHAELARWLAGVRSQRWAQADLLQVMEELEPAATRALTAYFILRAALPARAQTFGVSGGSSALPSVAAARSILAVAGLPADDPNRVAALAQYGHRGPGEARPDARRWADAPDLIARLTAHGASAPPSAVGPVHPLIHAADLAWDAVIMVIAAAQHWSVAAAREARAAGLIAQPEDVVFLELEELKQVATGEWHGGRAAETAAAVAQRKTFEVVRSCASPETSKVYPADAGAAPFWLTTPGTVVVADDPWSPSALVARSLGLAVTIER